MFRHSKQILKPLALAVHIGLLTSVAGFSLCTQAAPTAHEQLIRQYRIAPGLLSDAVSQFAASAGIALSFDASQTRGLQSTGLSGRYDIEAGFAQLLSGTGLQAQRLNDGSYRLQTLALADGRIELSATTVSASTAAFSDSYVVTQAPGITKSAVPLIETPQSISVITRKQMDNQNVKNLGEALRYSAGVNAEPFGADNRNDYIYIRGFDQSNDGLYLDGLNLLNRNYAMWRVDPYSLERIEVVRGPSSVLFGQSSPGGLVNQVSKRASQTPVHQVRIQYGNDDRKVAAFDIGGALDDQGQWSGRLTAQIKDGSTQIDHVAEESWFIAPSITWDIDDDTSLSVFAQVQRERYGSVFQYLPYYGTVKSNPLGKRYDPSLFAGEPDFDHYDRDQDSIGYEFSHRVDDTWSVKQNFRYRHLKLDYQTVYGLGYWELTPTQPSDYGQGFRGALTSNTQLTGWALDNQVQADFSTGPVEHRLLLGADLQYTTYDILNKGSKNGDPNPFDFYNPVYGWTPNDLQTNNDLNASVRQLGIYAQDQFKLDQWAFSLGGRVDWARVVQNNDGGVGNPAGNTQRNDRKATWRAGVVYVADNGLAPYYSYSQSFVPTVGLTSKIMEPTTGQQHEIGIKYQPKGSNSSVTLSAFDLRKQNVPTTDPNDPNQVNQIQIGETRSRGIELEAVASLSESLNLVTSYTYNKVKITKDTDFQGNRPYNVPEHMASAWLDYTFKSGGLKGFGLGAGARYVGSTYGDDANQLRVPGYSLFDAMAHYDIEQWRLQLNATNLLDNQYATCQNGQYRCNYGYPRMVTATVEYNW